MTSRTPDDCSIAGGVSSHCTSLGAARAHFLRTQLDSIGPGKKRSSSSSPFLSSLSSSLSSSSSSSSLSAGESGGGDGVFYYDNGLIDADDPTVPDYPKYLKALLLKSTLGRNKPTDKDRLLRESWRYKSDWCERLFLFFLAFFQNHERQLFVKPACVFVLFMCTCKQLFWTND